MTTAILIPADSFLPCRIIELPSGDAALDTITQLVGGQPEQARYDRDAALFVDRNGVALLRARNDRATQYALVHSEAARTRGVRPDTPTNALPYALHGDVLLVGVEEQGCLTDLPERFYDPDHLGWEIQDLDAGREL
jgi:hypothetical protein